MSTSGSGPGEKDGPGTERSQPQRTDVAGKPVSAVEEVSGLHDIRSLAASTMNSVRERRGTDSDVAESLLASASPAALGQVVLPAPGREVAPSAPRVPVGAGAASVPVSAIETGGRRSMLPAVLVAGFALAAAAAIVIYVMSDGKPQQVAIAPQAAAQPNELPAAEAARVAPGDTATGGAIANADEAPKPAELAPTAVEADPAEGGAGSSDPGAAGPDDAKGKKTAVVAKEEAKDKKERAAAEKKPEGVPADPKTDPVAKEPEAKPPEGTGTDGEKKPKSAQDEEIDAILNDAQKKDEKKEEAPVEEAAPETLSREDIKKGMGLVRARVQGCYDKYKIPGTVSVKARIEPDGSVSSAEAIDKFAATETGLCVSNAVETAKFRTFKGAPMTIKYPFKLE